MRTSWIIIVAISCTLMACKDNKTPVKTTKAAKKQTAQKQPIKPTKATTAKTSAETIDIKQDEAIVAAMRAVVTKCKAIKQHRGRQCPNNEQKNYEAMVAQRGVEAFDTLVSIFATSTVPQMRQLAAHGLGHTMIPAFGTGKLSLQTAMILKSAVLKEDPQDKQRLAMATVKAAVHALNVTKQYAQVKALDDAIDASKSRDHMWLKYHIIENAMLHGRLKQFDLIQTYAKSTNTSLQRAAFHAPRRMQGWTQEEEAQICPWAKQYLSKTDKDWNAGPTWLLLKCKDRQTYAKAIVDEAAHRIKARTFARPFTFAFRELCARRSLGPKNYNTDPQCKRARQLLLDAADNAQLPKNERVVALSAIAYQWRDEESLKIMQRYAKSKDEDLAKMAQNETRMLNRWIAKRQKKN